MSAYNYLTRRTVKRSLRFSIADGSAHAAMLGLTQSYITPFALALKATTAQIGLLTSVPNFSMALSQLSAPFLSDIAGSRKRFMLPVVFLHALMWVPILLVPYLFHGFPVAWLIGFVTLSMVLGSVANPAWGSMMADLVPDVIRGRYFSNRSRICSFITLVFSFAGGAILQIYTKDVFTGFAMLFGGATMFRLISLYYLSRMYEPQIIAVPGPRPKLSAMLRELAASNLGRFMMLVALINFSANIASPFFSVYMLRDLQFSYIAYITSTSFAAVSSLVFVPFWGRRADRGGNLKVIQITCWLLPIVPLVWLASSNFFYILAAQVLSGFTWSGFQLASTNFLYDSTRSEYRTRYIAMFNAVAGLSVCFGALIGGFIAPHLPDLLGYNLKTLFTISGVARGISVLVLLRTIAEVRKVPAMKTVDFLFRQPLRPRRLNRPATAVAPVRTQKH